MTKVRCKDLPDSDRGDFRCRRAVDSSSYVKLFQIWEQDSIVKGPYCKINHPPAYRSISNRLDIKYIYEIRNTVTGFIAYYETIGPIPNHITSIMAASRRGFYHSEAITFLISPLMYIPEGGYCLTFLYSMRSNLRVKATSHKNTATLVNWVVDGGRAFHRAVLPLPYGHYKLIWETTDGRKVWAKHQTPYNRYFVTVDDINIHPLRCLDMGRFYSLHSSFIVGSIYTLLPNP